MTMAFHCGFRSIPDLSVSTRGRHVRIEASGMRPGNKRGEATTDNVISNGYEIDWKEIEHETSIV